MTPSQLASIEHKAGEGLFTPELLRTSAWFSVQDYSLLIGLVVGVALIALTIRRRRYSDVLA